MGDSAGVYEATRRSIIEFLEERPEDDVERPVPATPGWRVRDVVAHLVGDADCITRGDFPLEFFGAFGQPAAVERLNEWTDGHVKARSEQPFKEVVAEWDELAPTVVSMLSSEIEWPAGVPPFADRVIVADLGVHQQDIFGTFGIERDREGAPVKIGVAGYIAIMGLRLESDGTGTLAFEAPGKRWVAGGDNPDATVGNTRFELFRALSGRRNLEQLRRFDWEGDPEPFLPYFYPYGIREEALVE